MVHDRCGREPSHSLALAAKWGGIQKTDRTGSTKQWAGGSAYQLPVGIDCRQTW